MMNLFFKGLPAPLTPIYFLPPRYLSFFCVGDLRFAPIVLTQKVNKKVKAQPASLKKLAFASGDYPCFLHKLLTLGIAQTSLALRSLNRNFGSPCKAVLICMSKIGSLK
jgi:hypothetical protein